MDYAYSVLEYDQKKFYTEDEKYFYVKGVASTPSPDRVRDIVEPDGAKYKTPMPFLWMHKHDKPVGEMTFAEPKKNGIPFEASLPKISEPGLLKDQVDLAIHSIKYQLVKAVSIGFNAIEWSWMDNGGIHFKEWEWLELSLVTIPANAEALLDAAKAYDRVNRAALGIKDNADFYKRSLPGVAGRRPIQLIPAKR